MINELEIIRDEETGAVICADTLTLSNKINEIIEVLNKKEEVIITVTPGEYKILDAYDQKLVKELKENDKNYISKKELKEYIIKNKRKEVNGNMTDDVIVCADLFNKFNL